MLRRLRQRWRLAAVRSKVLAALGLLLGLAALALLLRGGWLVPANPGAELHRLYGTTRLLDRHGRTLQAWSGAESTRHRRLQLAEVSPRLIAATLAMEDQRFWQHPGVDVRAMLRATAQNLRARRVVSGASTLTQQLCKWLEPRGRSLGPKLVEVLAALHLESKLEKREILELYLSYAPYGGVQRGAVQASLAWLGKPAADLTWAEAAWLAVLPRSPARLDPALRPRAALADQRRLLQKMAERQVISPAELQQALAQPIEVVTDPRPLRAPHLAEHIAATLPAELAARAAAVQTAVDGDLQQAVEQRTRAHLQRLAERDVGNAAVVVIDTRTAEVLALVGSANYADVKREGANNGALALRQPGSTLKAFAYAAAFDRGWSPASLLLDLAAQFHTPQGLWSPKNYGHREHGPVLARQALASSLNLPAVRLLDQLGVAVLRQALDQLGFNSLVRDAAHYGLALVLGDGEVTLLELTAAFASLSRGGLHLPPQLVLAVADAQGQRWPAVKSMPVQVFSPEAAWQTWDVLADPSARELAFGRGGPLELPFPAAVKTGTSKGFRDNWAVGTTTRYTVGVWAGHFDGRQMQDVSGVTGAAPLLREVLVLLHQAEAPQAPPRPGSLQLRQVCSLSGQAAGPNCPQKVGEWLGSAQAPQACAWHRQWPVDKRNGLLAGPACDPSQVEQRALVRVPAELRAWAQGRMALAPEQDSPLCAPAAGQGDGGGAPGQLAAGQVRIAVPLDRAHYQINPRMPPDQQAVALQARQTGAGQLRWKVDGQRLAPTAAGQWLWPLQRGDHTLVCELVDSAGRVLAVDRATVRVD